MCGVSAASLTLIIVTAMVGLPGAVIDTVAACTAPVRHAVNTDIGAVETERDSDRDRRPLTGSGTWMDVTETARDTGNAGGGACGSSDTIGQYGVIAAAAATDAASAPRHANGTGQQAGGGRADVRRAAGDRWDGRGGARGACGARDNRAGDERRPPPNGKWSYSTWAPGGCTTAAGWLVAALLALVAVLAAMAEAVKAVGRAGRPLCCHGCEGVHAGGTQAVKLAARAHRFVDTKKRLTGLRAKQYET